MYDSIVVVCDPQKDRQAIVNFELLGKAKQLATELNCLVKVLYIGVTDGNYVKKLYQYGADIVYEYILDGIDSYQEFSELAEVFIRKLNHSMVMFPATEFCKAVAATVTVGTKSGLVADCTKILIDDEKRFVYSRTAQGTSVIANIICVESPVEICTVKRNIFQLPIPQNVDLVRERYQFSNSNIQLRGTSGIRVIERICSINKLTKDLQKEKIIMALGRGVTLQAQETARKIADCYKFGLACTRPMVEAGLMEKDQQVGQSGIIVKPNLYIALGISGSSQHIVGMCQSKFVIAVNQNPHAPIFQYSDIGIVGDAHCFLRNLAGKIGL